MTVSEIAEAIGARVLNPEVPTQACIDAVYAGDRMSDLLSHASPTTLVVTNLASHQLMRAAALMDVPAICLLHGVEPAPEVVAAAGEHGTAVLVSPLGMFETCGRIYAELSRERQAGK